MRTDAAALATHGCLLTVDEAAEYLNVGARFVRRLVHERRIPVVRLVLPDHQIVVDPGLQLPPHLRPHQLVLRLRLPPHPQRLVQLGQLQGDLGSGPVRERPLVRRESLLCPAQRGQRPPLPGPRRRLVGVEAYGRRQVPQGVVPVAPLPGQLPRLAQIRGMLDGRPGGADRSLG